MFIQILMSAAVDMNPFESSQFAWCDAGMYTEFEFIAFTTKSTLLQRVLSKIILDQT